VTQATVPTGHDLALCISDLRSRKKEAALAEMVMAARELAVIADPELLLELLRLRERLGNTGLGKGIAVPQARSSTVLVPRVIVARSARGIDWGATDETPVTLAMLVLAPAEWSDEAYFGLISRTASATRLQRNRQKLMDARSLDAFGAAWKEAAAS
jgi:fructose PTS system EIIBC or EIIC component